MDADLFDAQHLSPDARQHPFDRRARRDERTLQVWSLAVRRGQSPAIHFAVRRQRQGGKADELRRDHVVGQLLFQSVAQFRIARRLAFV